MSQKLSARANQLAKKYAALPKGKPSWVGPGEDASFGVVIDAGRVRFYRDRIAKIFGTFEAGLKRLSSIEQTKYVHRGPTPEENKQDKKQFNSLLRSAPQLRETEKLFAKLVAKVDHISLREAARTSYNIIMKLNDVRLEIHENKKITPTEADTVDKTIQLACDQLWKAAKSIISDPAVMLTWPYGPGLNPTMPAQVRDNFDKGEERRQRTYKERTQNRPDTPGYLEYQRIMNSNSPEQVLADAHKKWKEQNLQPTFEEYEKAFPEYADNEE
jgi:hypothetical protein